MSVPALSQMTIADQNYLIIKLLEQLVNPLSTEPGTARVRVSIEALTATLQINTLAGYGPRETQLNAAELTLWADAIRSRIT